MTSQFLIIGQGLAGTALAWQLLERGAKVWIVDRNENSTSSRVAAGLVTPVTGMRLNASWRYETLYPEAHAFYRKYEIKLGGRFYYEVPVVRLLRDEKAATLWNKRRLQADVLPWLSEGPEPLVNPSVFNAPYGGFQQKHCGWLDTAAWLEASRRHFETEGRWMEGDVRPEELVVEDKGVAWQGRRFNAAIFCTGWEVAQHPWFNWVPFQSARGSVLTVEADTRGEGRIINRGCWLLPRQDGTLRAGPTYELNFNSPDRPGTEALAGLEKKLSTLLKIPFRITGCQTGVRPIIQDKQVLMGCHPARPRIAFLNGLGSKGVLRAPWAARQLAERLLEGKPVEADLDLAANL